jgi:GT2 family glycosyltransferase
MEWLPAVLAALAGQTRPADRLVIVDAGSLDGSGACCARMLTGDTPVAGGGVVLRVGRGTPFGAAVAAGIAAVGGPPDAGFVWLLHDDAAPRPDALERLLAYAATDPSAAVLGPKIHDWHRPDTVHEVGVGVDRAARRATGIVGGERDRGQHDAVGDVLAVSTAGALVRSSAWRFLGGLDEELPAGLDVDFGWRAGFAGLRVVVVPAAVVRHARAALTGRRMPWSGRTRRRAHRGADLYVRLVNTPTAWLPVLGTLLAAGCVARALGLAARARPAAAMDELAAMAAVAAAPRRLWRGSRARAVSRQVPRRALRPLVTAAPRARRRRDRGSRPAAAADRAGPGGHRAWIPLAIVLAGFGCVPGWSAIGPAAAAGRLPPPAGASDLWTSLATGWQGGGGAGLGGPGPPPAWTPVLAFLATVCGGKPWLALDALLVVAAPLAGVAAYAATARLRARAAIRLAAGFSYGLVPLVTGAVALGRFDAVIAMAALPLVLAAAGTVLAGSGLPGSGHPGVGPVAVLGPAARLGAVLSLVLACAPRLAPALAVLALGAVAWRLGGPPGGRRQAAVVGVGALAVPGFLLWPWMVGAARHPTVLITGAGGGAGHAIAGGAAVWFVALALGAAFAVVGLAALARPAAAGPALVGWAVAAAGLGSIVAGGRGWPGPAVALAAAGLLLAAHAGAQGGRAWLRGRAFSWRQPAAVAIAAVLGSAPLVLAVLVAEARGPVPGPARGVNWAALAGTDGGRVLVLAPDPAGAVRFSLVGPAGPTLADLGTRTPAPARAFTAALVADLVAGRGDAAAGWLGTLGVRTVAVGAGATPSLVAALDGAPGLVRDQVGAAALVWRPEPGDGGPAAAPYILDPAAARMALGTRAIPSPPALPAPLGAGVPAAGGPGAGGRVGPGPAGRLVVLAAPADRGWHATLSGRRLPRRVAWGFAAAFVLPARPGTLRVGFDDTGPRVGLAARAAGLVAVALLAAGPGVRRRFAAGPGPAA